MLSEFLTVSDRSAIWLVAILAAVKLTYWLLVFVAAAVIYWVA
jgi:hypothetical protein